MQFNEGSRFDFRKRGCWDALDCAEANLPLSIRLKRANALPYRGAKAIIYDNGFRSREQL